MFQSSNNIKTLGRTSAHLISKLYEDNKQTFNISDAQEILQKDYNQTTELLSELVKRKVISRLKDGKFLIIPQEIGNVDNYFGNWLVAASEVVNSPDYYVGFYSAMNHWGMVTQPLLRVFVATPKSQVVPRQLRDHLIFVYMKEKFIWGVKEEWTTQTRKVRMSDPEKTILDGLLYPENCGGITEIAKGIWIIREKLDYDKLGEYVKKYNKNVIAKRLGYILEILEINCPALILKLQKYIKDRYDLFDPAIPYGSKNKNSWRLMDNVDKEQILNIIKH